MFEDLTPAPPDPILGLTEAFKADPRPEKVNLGVGVYQNAEGRTPVLEAVKAAEAVLLAGEKTKNYFPIAGEPEFGKLVEQFLFAPREVAHARTAQAPGGTGALRIAADFLAEISRERAVWATDPTWPNHRGVFGAAGLAVKSLPYYDAALRSVGFERYAEALEQVPAGDAVVLHLCCHNPSGADLTPDQWAVVAGIAARRGWLPLFDAAYIGFAEGLETDRSALLPFLDAGLELFIAVSFSKNFGLYRERAGALTLVAASAKGADAAFSRVKRVIRAAYSNPPGHAGSIVRTILEDSLLRDVWRRELTEMRGRIHAMREALSAGLARRVSDRDFSFIVRQHGMFSYSGLNADQVAWLRTERAIYMTADGRINIAGLTPANLDYVCDAIAEAIRRVR